jgi:hypothetical protein
METKMRINRISFITTLVFMFLATFFGARLGDQVYVALGDNYYGWAYVALIAGIIFTGICLIKIVTVEIAILNRPNDIPEERNLDRFVLSVCIMLMMAFCFGALAGPFQTSSLFQAFANGWGILLMVGIFPIVLRVVNSVRPPAEPNPKER